jgi:heme-degrading monooxygenase HmoA
MRLVSPYDIMLAVERFARGVHLHAGERRDVAMHARMTTLEGSPGRMDEGVREVREDVLPQLQQQDGFKGFLALGDRHSGKLVGITFWESEQAMRDAEEVADRMRSESAEEIGDIIVGVERFEVGLFEMSG